MTSKVNVLQDSVEREKASHRENSYVSKMPELINELIQIFLNSKAFHYNFQESNL